MSQMLSSAKGVFETPEDLKKHDKQRKEDRSKKYLFKTRVNTKEEHQARKKTNSTEESKKGLKDKE